MGRMGRCHLVRMTHRDHLYKNCPTALPVIKRKYLLALRICGVGSLVTYALALAEFLMLALDSECLT